MLRFVLPVFSIVFGLGLGSVSETQASTVYGETVDDYGSSTSVGMTEYRSALGGEAIKYYIPLTDGDDCTYGVDCGTYSDTGYGGTQMSMFLEFDGVSTVDESFLMVHFEDLDLEGVNDPYYFIERINIYDASGSITGVIDNISSAYVTGDYDTQQILSLSLGVLTTSVYYMEFVFDAASDYYGRNTPEYLRAKITSSAIPLPASGLLLLGALGAIGLRRRRQI